MDEGGGVVLDFGFFDTALLLLVMAWLAGRLLGVHRGFWRSLSAGVIGLVAGLGLVYAQFGDVEELRDPADVLQLGVGFFGYVLLVTMLASIVIEALLRPRAERGRRRLPHPIRRLKAQASALARVWEIVRVGRRHGVVGRHLGRRALSSPEGARGLRLTLEDCGGMFVKFGQIAAGRDDFLPETVTTELAELRTAVKPLPADEVRAVLTGELGPRFETEFASFDFQPLAAASIGVTHRAVLASGQPVIVKVQRPGIEEIVERDGRVLLWAARQLERGSGSARTLGIVDLCEELLASVNEELDFNREAANNAAMRRHHTHADGIAFPVVRQDLTSRRVLVMDEVAGRPISDSAAVATAVAATGVDRSELADRLLLAFLDQVLRDGVYHADPHPGNVLIDAAGTMWFIDFGAVGTLDPITLEALQQMAIGFTLRDPGLLARSVRRLSGSAGADLDIASLEYDMGHVLGKVEGGGFGPAAIAEVVHVLRRHSVSVPRPLTILGRAAVTMEGTLRALAPGYEMAERAQTLVRAEAPVDNARELARDELIRALPSLRPMPQLTEDLALQLRSGRLSLQVERFGDKDAAHVERWLDRILWASIGLVGLVGSAVLLLGSMIAPNEPGAAYMRIIGFVGLVAASAMQMRTIAGVLKRRDPRDVG